MRRLLTVGSLTLVLVFATTLSSQSVNQHSSVNSILNQEGVRAAVPWNVDDANLLCVIRQVDSAPTKTIAIYKTNGSQATQVFEAQTGDWYLSAFPLKEEGRLLVAWGSGSAYHFQIYSYTNGKVQKVLDADSRGMPEIVFDDEGRESLLFTNEKLVGGEWKNSAGATTVFKWDGQGYEKIGTIPWAKRFSCLSKESCVAVK